MRLQAAALESALPQPEGAAPLALRDDPAKAFFNEGLHGGPLSVSQLARFFK
jgi:hypothetical protein